VYFLPQFRAFFSPLENVDFRYITIEWVDSYGEMEIQCAHKKVIAIFSDVAD